MKQFSNHVLKDLLAEQVPPCISLYQPTHRHHPGTAEDPIRFRNLLAEAEDSLRRKYPKVETASLLARLRPYERDAAFWNHQLDGLAMFTSAGLLRVIPLQCEVRPLAVVADSFHLKPLMRIMQAADRYQVLCLSQGEVRLYEGNQYALDEVELVNVPRNLVEALGEEATRPHLTVASHAGTSMPATRHGHGAQVDEQRIDLERFYRAVDRAVWENHSRPTGLPLMLAGLSKHQSIFRAVSHNTRLMPEGIELHPNHLEAGRLRDEAWRIFEPHCHRRIQGAVDSYRSAMAHQMGADQIRIAAEAAASGRIETLMVEADRHVPGRMDGRGRVEFGPLDDPGVDDLLDDIAERVLASDGRVFVVPREQMPSATGLAATYRF